MTRPVKALCALAALLPASLGAALLVLFLDVARNATERRDAAEHETSEHKGALREARSALAAAVADALCLTRVSTAMGKHLDDMTAANERLASELASARAEVERLTREAARENEANTADRETAARLKVDNDGLRGDLHRAERSGLRAAFQLLDARRDLDACYDYGWSAIVGRDAWREQAQAEWARANAAEATIESIQLDAQEERELHTAIANDLAHMTRERNFARAQVETEHRGRLYAEARAEKAEADLATLRAEWAAPVGQRWVLVPIEGDRVEPVAAPPVAEIGCAACGGDIEPDIDPEANTWLDGKVHKLCGACYENRPGDDVDADIRARHAARALPPVAAAPAAVEPLTPATLAAALAEGRAMRPALEERLAATSGPAAPTQDDLDDRAVRELLSRGPATWWAIGDVLDKSAVGKTGPRVESVFQRLGLVGPGGHGGYSLPAAPEATVEREGGR